jgi:hypothetical protein
MDEEELIWLKMTEVYVPETALGRYAALMSRQVFCVLLLFWISLNREWTNLKMKKLREEASTALATIQQQQKQQIRQRHRWM